MTIINLTPHAINIIETTTATTTTIAPSGEVARCNLDSTPTDLVIAGVPVLRPTYGAVTGLPAAAEGTFYIVSALVRSALPTRTDLLSPGELVRNEAGQVVGCKSLHCN